MTIFDIAKRRKIGNRRNAVDAAARELLDHLLQLRDYTHLDPDEEALVSMLRNRFRRVDGEDDA